jgi:ABC-2 type transport system ATP-binding protein
MYDSYLTLGVKRGEEKIPLIIEIAQSLNEKIKAISVRKPTLDDVFLSYTGRKIRDNESVSPFREAMKMYKRGRG